MKDGHMWKSVRGWLHADVDSLIAGDAKWDSATEAKCGDGFRLATLKDYYNTDFEYMEHSEAINQYMYQYMSGNEMGVAYMIPSVKDDTDGMTINQITGGSSFWGQLRLRLVIMTPLRGPPGDGVWRRGGAYDSVTSIPYRYDHETIMGGHLVACISDTIYGAKPSIDTVSLIKMDTIYNVDTIRINQVDTVYKMDTVSLIKTDTVTLNREIHDTVMVVDSHTIVDTSVVVRYDTIVKLNTDTVRITDTVDIVTHDTVNTCRDGTLGQYYEKLSKAKGTYSNTGLTIVEMEPEVSPSVEVQTDSYVEIQAYVYDNLGVAVSSRKYTLRPSARQYIAFGGYSDSGLKVPSGVYLMRIVSRHNDAISNNVYRIGISD